MGILVLLVFFVLFMAGVPVVVAIFIPAAAYIVLQEIPIAMVAQRTVYALDSFPLVAIPVFILVGSLMNSAKITDKIFNFADVLVGRLPGGLAQVNVFGSLIFAGMSGAALADVGGLGKVEIKAMRDRGYSLPFSCAVTVASAIVGPIFPPSIPLIIYGSIATVSTVQLLIGGIVPGLLCTGMLMLAVWAVAARHNLPRAARWPTLRELWNAFVPAAPALAAPVLLIFGMLSGFFTPTEAAAVTCVYVLAIAAFVYRDLNWQHIRDSMLETLRSSSSILVIVAAAAMFGWILAVEQVPQAFDGWLDTVSSNPWVLLLVVNLIFFIAGMFIDSTTATLLLVPIVTPPVVAAGVDPVHLGLVVIFNLMIGTITPPFGLSLFLVSDITKAPVAAILKALLPFYPALLTTLALLTFVPELVLWIPKMIR
ncbi:MAG: TRAP transporter large permease [Alphaproteobacteria bacterium]|nr:TRAP transporter large permease [Alphaproteobacteria bacterium]